MYHTEMTVCLEETRSSNKIFLFSTFNTVVTLKPLVLVVIFPDVWEAHRTLTRPCNKPISQ